MTTRINRSLFACALVAGLSGTARADLLVYEGFNYATGTSMIGTAPGAGTVGLDQSAVYETGNPGVFTVQSESLSFGPLATSGGSSSFTTATSVAAVKLSLDTTPFTGTLWSSYLVKLDGHGGNPANGVGTRVANTEKNEGDRFQSLADSRNSTSHSVATLYGAGNTSTGSGVVLDTGTTYMLISRFTNVGRALNGTTTTGVATVWALTQEQFEHLVEANDREAYLNATVSGTGVKATATTSPEVTSGTFKFETGNYAQFVSVNNSGVYDELRFGSTLADVTPIPEPASVAAVVGLLAGGLAWRRRRVSC